jgi:arylsulfatase A-like enzyme
MIETIDQSTGRIMQKVKELGIEKNTIIVFTSDNGGLSTYAFPLPGEEVDAQEIATSNLPLRSGKGWYYEGGIRIPTIIRWPGVVDDSLIISTPLTTTDYYPTLLRLTGNKLLPAQHKDGIDFSGTLLNEREHKNPDLLYWHYPHYHNSGQHPVSVIRNERFKLIYHYDKGATELYDLILDEEESRDISEKRPAVTEMLLEELEKWKKEVNAKVPRASSR